MPSSPPTPAREAPESPSHSPLGSPVPQSPTLDRLAKHDAEYSDDDDDDEEEEEEEEKKDKKKKEEEEEDKKKKEKRMITIFSYIELIMSFRRKIR